MIPGIEEPTKVASWREMQTFGIAETWRMIPPSTPRVSLPFPVVTATWQMVPTPVWAATVLSGPRPRTLVPPPGPGA